jgi:hypothetical protein
MAVRPLYQPQLPHTVWGSFADEHRGHELADGARRRHAAAMWLRPFIFDFFFLGTGMARPFSCCSVVLSP